MTDEQIAYAAAIACAMTIMRGKNVGWPECFLVYAAAYVGVTIIFMMKGTR